METRDLLLEPRETALGVPWLRFQVGGQLFAIPLDAVVEVTAASRPHLIPLVSPTLGGVVNVRGEPLPAVYGGVLLGGARARKHLHLMVLERGPVRIGVLAEEVTTIERGIEPPEDEEMELPADVLPEVAEFVRWIRHADGPLGLVEPDCLLECAERALELRSEGRLESCQSAF